MAFGRSIRLSTDLGLTNQIASFLLDNNPKDKEKFFSQNILAWGSVMKNLSDVVSVPSIQQNY